MATIPVGVIVERAKAASQWIDYIWRPTTVLAGQPDTPPWTLLADDGERATFYAGPAMVEMHRTETASYRDNLANRIAVRCGWCSVKRRRTALRALSRDRRSGRGRRHDGGRQQHRRAGTDAGRPPRYGCGLRREHHVEEVFVKRKRDRRTLNRSAAARPRRRGMSDDGP